MKVTKNAYFPGIEIKKIPSWNCRFKNVSAENTASHLPPLCTFAVLPAARKIFSTSVAVHILCAASTYHRWYHGILFRWSLLLCTSSVLPARQAPQTFFSICNRCLLCTFSALPAYITAAFVACCWVSAWNASAVHIRCAASSAQNLQHVGGCAHSLRCQHTAPPVPWHTIPLVAAAVHILCAASKTCSPDIFSICSRCLLCTFSALPAHITAAFVACCWVCTWENLLCTFAVLPTGRLTYASAWTTSKVYIKSSKKSCTHSAETIIRTHMVANAITISRSSYYCDAVARAPTFTYRFARPPSFKTASLLALHPFLLP